MLIDLYKKGKIFVWAGFFGTVVFWLLRDAGLIELSSYVKFCFTVLIFTSYCGAIWGAVLVLRAKQQSYFWLVSLFFYLFGILIILYFLEDRSGTGQVSQVALVSGQKVKSDRVLGLASLTISLLMFWLYYHIGLSLYLNGTKTQGVVVSPDANNPLKTLHVQYFVKGKSYSEADQTSFEPIGSTVVVHYNDNDPSNAIFTPKDSNFTLIFINSLKSYYMFFLISILCLLVALKAFGLLGSKSEPGAIKN